ncbi:hypothetical protein CQW23_13839 [Capsicum baccatum]|uniref:Ubiquitin-like protease family profile domain-containing protein n=1 Tax=Capsicum baccatum TaxID=33114 RepID=A0A2G2WHG9_CAPBA|nr:hypothetical protein CQW23_13839 [Capsicum baccatum]
MSSFLHVLIAYYNRLINKLTVDFFSYGFKKENNETIIVFAPGDTILDVIDINYMKPIKFKLSLLHTIARLRLLSYDTVEVLPLLFRSYQLFDGATATVFYVQKEERKYHFLVSIERNELFVLLLPHLNTFCVLPLRTSPLRIIKLYGSVTGTLVNVSELHLLYDAFRYVLIVQVWFSPILGVVEDKDQMRCEMSTFSWIQRFICSCLHTKHIKLSHSEEITNYNLRGRLSDSKANGHIFVINWLAQSALLILLKLTLENFLKRVIKSVFCSCKHIHGFLQFAREKLQSSPVSKLQFKKERYTVASLQFEVASIVEHWLALFLKARTSFLSSTIVHDNRQLWISSIEQIIHLQVGHWYWYFCGCFILPKEQTKSSTASQVFNNDLEDKVDVTVETTAEEHNITGDNPSTTSKEEEKVKPASSGERKNYSVEGFNISDEAPKKLTKLINDYSEWIVDGLLKHYAGSIPTGLLWNLVDEVYIPINYGDEFHWMLAIVVLKERHIRVYDSMSQNRRFSPSFEIQKLAKIFPTYLDMSRFLDQKVHTDWSTIEAYRDKMDNPFDVQYVEGIAQ